MSTHGTTLATIVLLAAIGGGIIAYLIVSLYSGADMSAKDGGLVAAAFLSIREVVSKMEKVALSKPGGDE